LLNKQTAVELQKEQNVKFLELKSKTYEQLISKIEDIVLVENISDDDIIRLQFITHRLAIFSSPPVLEEFHRFLEAVNMVARDRNISTEDSKALSESLANLTVKIREDLLGESDLFSGHSLDMIKRQIIENSSESMELST